MCVCVYEGGFRGRVLLGTVQRQAGGFGRVGNHSLRVLYRLFLLPFHLSRWGAIFLRLTAPSLIKHFGTKVVIGERGEGFSCSLLWVVGCGWDEKRSVCQESGWKNKEDMNRPSYLKSLCLL